jgi:hypothetical protein
VSVTYTDMGVVVVAAPGPADGSSAVHSAAAAYRAFSDDAAKTYIASRSDPCIGRKGFAYVELCAVSKNSNPCVSSPGERDLAVSHNPRGLYPDSVHG